MAKKAILLLSDGTLFEGKSVGFEGTSTGEIAFNTAMTGYQEVFTDPSYHKQIIVMATAHIGNYGVATLDNESDGIKIAGLICKKFSPYYSRVGGQMSLQDFLLNNKVVGISDIDTRALVRHIRNKGAMNCIISSENLSLDEMKSRLNIIPDMNGLSLSSDVSTNKTFEYGPSDAKYTIGVIDYGFKENILRCLTQRNCKLKVFPNSTSAEEIISIKPDGVMLTNGPGDPAAMPFEIAQIQKLLDNKFPIFGICMGHQLLCHALGLKTEKMFNGHRGINHPVIELESFSGEITSQNHGFMVSEFIETEKNVKITHRHLNDNSIAGIEAHEGKVFSVQFHPESSAGPNDSRYLFDKFITNIEKQKLK